MFRQVNAKICKHTHPLLVEHHVQFCQVNISINQSPITTTARGPEKWKLYVTTDTKRTKERVIKTQAYVHFLCI